VSGAAVAAWILFHVGGQVPAISGRQRQQQHLFYSYVALALLSMRSPASCLACLLEDIKKRASGPIMPLGRPDAASLVFSAPTSNTRYLESPTLNESGLLFKLEWRGLLIAQNVETNVGVTSFSRPLWAYHFQTVSLHVILNCKLYHKNQKRTILENHLILMALSIRIFTQSPWVLA
jgi:hypothetical protein